MSILVNNKFNTVANYMVLNSIRIDIKRGIASGMNFTIKGTSEVFRTIRYYTPEKICISMGCIKPYFKRDVSVQIYPVHTHREVFVFDLN